MATAALNLAGSKTKLWTGRVVSALTAAILILSGAMKLAKPAPVVEGFARVGYPESLILGIGITEVACAVIYAIPRTAVFGAILITGLMGGATATNVRVGDPMFFMPVIVGVLAWGGLFFRDERLRALLPVRT